MQSEGKMVDETSRAETYTATEDENVTRCSYEHESSCRMVSELGFSAEYGKSRSVQWLTYTGYFATDFL